MTAARKSAPSKPSKGRDTRAMFANVKIDLIHKIEADAKANCRSRSAQINYVLGLHYGQVAA